MFLCLWGYLAGQWSGGGRSFRTITPRARSSWRSWAVGAVAFATVGVAAAESDKDRKKRIREFERLYPNLHILDSRAIQAQFTIIRDKNSGTQEFVAAADRLMTCVHH